jgi:hypothetical protein
MKRFVAMFLVLCVAIVCFSTCIYGKDAEIVSRTIDTKFHAVDFNVTGAKLYIKQGKTQGMEISSDDNVADSIVTEVKEGVLKIYLDEYQSGYDTEIYLTVVNLDGVTLIAGNSDIIGQDKIKTDKITIKHELSTGTIDLKLEANMVTATLGSSGDIILSGTTKDEEISLLGSGNIKAYDLIASSSNVTIMGSGDVEVNVTGTLDVKLMGTGGVTYKGKPTVEKQILGRGYCKPYSK